MQPTIEKDRQLVRAGNYNTQEFSYIPLLVSRKQSKNTRNAQPSTLDMLLAIEDGLQKKNTKVLNHLKRIQKELLQQPDIFESTLKLLENREIEDELDHWAPGYRIASIYDFIVEILPDFISLYKEHFIKSVVCNKKPIDVLSFVKERFVEDYQTFEVIMTDVRCFKDLVSKVEWLGDTDIERVSKETLTRLQISEHCDIDEDIYSILAPAVCYMDVEIFGRMYQPSLLQFDSLINKNEKHKKWWIANGLTECEWESL